MLYKAPFKDGLTSTILRDLIDEHEEKAGKQKKLFERYKGDVPINKSVGGNHIPHPGVNKIPHPFSGGFRMLAYEPFSCDVNTALCIFSPSLR
jgi:hypothetical protein